MALATAGGAAPRGYFMPYRYAADAGRRISEGYPALTPYFAAAADRFTTVIESIDDFADPLLDLDGPPPEPRWTQDWFPGLDGAAMYAIIRSRRPDRIVEIGSGHSTRFMARAIRDGGFPCSLTAIDPAPRADIAALEIAFVKSPLQKAPMEAFAAMSAGDVLSIDSSHIAVAGSDVDILINRVLPDLPTGALIQIHDMFLPDAYPEAWTWREYNEQSIAAPLIHGGGYGLLWSSHWVRSRMAAALDGPVTRTLTVPAGAFESSLWLIKR